MHRKDWKRQSREKKRPIKKLLKYRKGRNQRNVKNIRPAEVDNLDVEKEKEAETDFGF